MLYRLGYTPKKSRLTPDKPTPRRQDRFLQHRNSIKEGKARGDPGCFMGATQPQRDPVIGYGWIKRRDDYPTKPNTGRRPNMSCAIEIHT